MKMFVVMDKELREILKNRLLLGTVLLPCLIFAFMPLAMLWGAQSKPLDPSDLESLYRLQPALRGLDATTASQLILVSQMMILYLMIPAMAPLVIASFSIIGEKQARSLEPLLATPISVTQLLLGKALAAVLPALVATWLSYAIALMGIAAAGAPLTFRAATNPIWIVSMLLLAPGLCIAAVALAVIISSRVNDTRVAQQASIILILPVVGLFIGQFSGQVLFGVDTVVLAALALALVDVGIFYVAVRLFRRETILTEWR